MPPLLACGGSGCVGVLSLPAGVQCTHRSMRMSVGGEAVVRMCGAVGEAVGRKCGGAVGGQGSRWGSGCVGWWVKMSEVI